VEDLQVLEIGMMHLSTFIGLKSMWQQSRAFDAAGHSMWQQRRAFDAATKQSN
jgi:hypothetical protein